MTIPKVQVSIVPLWQDIKSDYRYEPKFQSSSKERERLDEESWESDTHIWNIIANMGMGNKCKGMTSCFDLSFDSYKGSCWDERELTSEYGQSWDELILYPAYQDVYVTVPFHNLYCDLFDYSFEDLCNINDFRVCVRVRLETREQDRK